MMAHMIACTLGIVIDRILGDPPNWPHPVRLIGTLIRKLTNLLNKGHSRKWKGLFLVLLVVLVTTSCAFLLIFSAYNIHYIVGIAVEAVLIAIGLAQKSLRQAALDVYNPLVAGDLQEARVKLSWIVGRDTEQLDVSEVTRGVVETVSENTSDGVTAPLFYAFLFGAPGIWFYKAVNTLDSMVGYQNEQYQAFGWAAAKLDDVLNFIPSRMSGLLIILGTKNDSGWSLKERFRGWIRDARKHPSPNSGWLEAATAYQLGIQLGGLNSYKGVQSLRANMGIPLQKLTPQHIVKSISHMQVVTWLFWLICMLLGGGFLVITNSWR